MTSDLGFGDIAKRFRQKAASAPPTTPVKSFDEIYTLKAKMLGVLLRDARLAADKTPKECAEAVGISEDEYLGWEFGRGSPSLPELEILAWFLEVPVSHFWGSKTISAQREERQVPRDDFVALRQRVIGALLRKARKKARISQEDLAKAVGISPDRIMAYEFGLEPIPMTELSTIASAVGVTLSYFLENSSRLGEWLELQEEFKLFSQMPDELRRFVVQPVNRSYLELALKLSRMSVDELRAIAEGILDITY